MRLISLGAGAVLRRGVDTEDLMAAAEVVADLNWGGGADAEVHAVQAALVTDDELVAPIEKVRVRRAEPVVARERNLVGFTTGHVGRRLK